MFVQFRLRNFLSFKEEAVLDMTAIDAYKEHGDNLIDIGLKEKFARVATIYGANASGKSNLQKGMMAFQRIVMNSLSNTGFGGSATSHDQTTIEELYMPFRFDKERDSTEFEVTFIERGIEYRYGFEYNSDCILEEWLYKKNCATGRTTIIVERDEDGIDFGASVRKECTKYRDLVPQETLVLSLFQKLGIRADVFKLVFDKITGFQVIPADMLDHNSIHNASTSRMLRMTIDSDKASLLGFLQAIDSGIRDIYYDQRGDLIHFMTIHSGVGGEEHALDLSSESEGTIRSIILFIYINNAILDNKVVFIDELNVKLHPLLLKFIVALFYEEDTQAQLVYTTHDTTLMDKKFFRRDQVWFIEKNEFGTSELMSLAEFKVRSDASFEQDYLAGVYGAVPMLKNFESQKKVSKSKKSKLQVDGEELSENLVEESLSEGARDE